MLRSSFLFVALAAGAVATLAPNQARAEARVKVPFSFTVDGKVCPAGVYSVKSDAIGNSVTLVGRDASKIFTWVVVPVTTESDSKKVVLEFDQAGSDHTLRSIQYGTQVTSRLDGHRQRSEDSDDAARGGR